MRVFLDANILFSAAKSNGGIRRLLSDLTAKAHVLCADAYVVEEARRNLAAKSPQVLPILATLLGRVEIAPMQVSGPAISQITSLPEKDRPVLTAAVRMRCDILLTGDRADFGTFFGRSLAGIAIHSPQSLALALLR